MTGKAVIYSRISNDPEGRELGVTRQEEDCRALAERLDLTIVGTFTDNDVSASTLSKKSRPQYDAMIATVEAREADTILAYSNSRLTRRPMELEGLIRLHERTGMSIRTVVSGDDNLGTADGRMVARIKASVDAAEAERTSERARRAKAQAAADGRWRGGRRPYGYEADGVTVREDEAALIRQATRDVLAGRSLRTIAKEWPTDTTGTAEANHEASRIRRILLRPRNAGLLEVRGEIAGRASWPAIVTEAEWRAFVAVMNNPARRNSPGPERRWLGSGIYKCECGASMNVSGSRGRPFYTCSASKHVMRSQSAVDTAVVAVIHAYLNDPRIIDRLRPVADISEATTDRDHAQVLRQRLTVAEADYYEGLINGKQLREATERVEIELQAIAEREAGRFSGNMLGDVLAGADPAAAFDAATLDRQRAIVDLLLDVTIHRGRRGRPPGWKPGEPYADLDTVEIQWKGAPK